MLLTYYSLIKSNPGNMTPRTIDITLDNYKHRIATAYNTKNYSNPPRHTKDNKSSYNHV
jgi:hypothetical protein